MDTCDEPTDVEATVLNFRSHCVTQGLLRHDGSLVDLDGFRAALVSSFLEPIVVSSLDEYRARRDAGELRQRVLTHILVYVAWRDDAPVAARLRRSKLPEEEVLTYVAQRVGDTVQLVGEPELGEDNQRRLFRSIAEEVGAARIFDGEPPTLAHALRGMIGEEP
jgi:hypothetical protein